MDGDAPLFQQLQLQSALLFAQLGEAGRTTKAEIAPLDLLIREAQTREHRRAQFIARDRACYRLGSAFEPIGALELDEITLTGFLSLGTLSVLLLSKEALAHPAMSVADLLAGLFVSAQGRIIRAHGVRLRWEWLQQLYLEETERFLSSKKGRDPEARWRRTRVTANQNYLVGQISLLLEIIPPSLCDRGSAFDWIRGHRGNPRFTKGPPTADLSALAAAFR